MTEKELYEVVLTCHLCFVNEVVVHEKGKTYQAILHTCDYCKAYPTIGIDKKLRLERQLAIMHNMERHHLPNVLRLMYGVLNEK